MNIVKTIFFCLVTICLIISIPLMVLVTSGISEINTSEFISKSRLNDGFISDLKLGMSFAGKSVLWGYLIIFYPFIVGFIIFFLKRISKYTNFVKIYISICLFILFISLIFSSIILGNGESVLNNLFVSLFFTGCTFVTAEKGPLMFKQDSN